MEKIAKKINGKISKNVSALIVIIFAVVGFILLGSGSTLEAACGQPLDPCHGHDGYPYEYEYQTEIPEYPYQTPYDYETPYDYPYPTPYGYQTPQYGYQYQYVVPYEYEYEYQYQTPYGTPYAYQTPYGTPYAYQTPYGTPYAYQTPYATPPIYATPYGYQYQTESPIYSYQSPVAFNYSLSNSGVSNVTLVGGGGNAFTQNTITNTLLGGATQSVTLSLSGVPSGTSSSIAPSACSPNCASTISFTVGPSTLAGTYGILVTGSPLGKTSSFNLVVSPASPISVTCTASPSPALIGDYITWTAQIVGGTAPYTYSWSGTNVPIAPAPNTNPFNITYTTVGQKSATLTVTDNTGIVSSCAPGGVLQINFDPSFEEF